MTTRADWLALAARAEAAKGADRALDAEVACALCRTRLPTHTAAPIDYQPGMVRDAASRWSAPAYTASVDTALAVVPEGWRFTVENLSDAGPLAFCEHWPKSVLRKKPYTRGEAATPALALLAAACRAQAEEAGDG